MRLKIQTNGCFSNALLFQPSLDRQVLGNSVCVNVKYYFTFPIPPPTQELSSGAVNGQPLATVLGNDPLNRFRNIFFCQVLHKDDWFSKEIVSPFVFHAPKDVIWCRHRERELSPVIQYGVHIEIVILWIALCQVRKIINCHYARSWSCHILHLTDPADRVQSFEKVVSFRFMHRSIDYSWSYGVYTNAFLRVFNGEGACHRIQGALQHNLNGRPYTCDRLVHQGS